jgi:hypothetical protein
MALRKVSGGAHPIDRVFSPGRDGPLQRIAGRAEATRRGPRPLAHTPVGLTLIGISTLLDDVLGVALEDDLLAFLGPVVGAG